MTHPNIELLRRYSETLTAARAAEVLPYFTEDCVLHIPGRSPHAGNYNGQDAVLAYYTRIFQDTGGKFENLGVDDILASDTHAASLVHWRVTRAIARSTSTAWSCIGSTMGRSPRSGSATGTSTPTTSCSPTSRRPAEPAGARSATAEVVALHELADRGPRGLPFGLVAQDRGAVAEAPDLGHRRDDRVVLERPASSALDDPGHEVATDHVERR